MELLSVLHLLNYDNFTSFLDIHTVDSLSKASHYCYSQFIQHLCENHNSLVPAATTTTASEPIRVNKQAKGIAFTSDIDVTTLPRLPPTIRRITLGKEFNEIVDCNSICVQVTHLTFGSYFNKNVDNLPSSVTHIKFGDYFNSAVDHLPPLLQYLKFGYDFNQPVDHLPSLLTYLYFGFDFDQQVDLLPRRITHLRFGQKFNHDIFNLPLGITHLILGDYFDKPVDNYLTPLCSLQRLSFMCNFNHPVNNLPTNIKKVLFGFRFNQPIDDLPDSITHLVFNYMFNQPVSKWPADIKYIALNTEYSHPLCGLPHKVPINITFYRALSYYTTNRHHYAGNLRSRECPSKCKYKYCTHNHYVQLPSKLTYHN